MRSIFATLFELVLPGGARPGTPRTVIGPRVPPELRTYYATRSQLAGTVTNVFKFEASTTDYLYFALVQTTLGGAPYLSVGRVDLNIPAVFVLTDYARISGPDRGLTLLGDVATPAATEIEVPGLINMFLGSDLQYNGNSIFNWQTTWTPTPTGTMNFGGVGASATGQFVRIGQTFLVEGTITLGAGFAIGDAGVSLPATPSPGITYDLGAAPMQDTSLAQNYFGRVRRFGTGMRFEYITAAGQYAVITGAAPFAFAAGDILRINAQFHV